MEAPPAVAAIGKRWRSRSFCGGWRLQGIIEALCRCEVLFGAEREEQAHG